MKKSFKSLIAKADAKTLEPFFADIDREKVMEDTVLRIRKNVLAENASKKTGKTLKRWLPVLAAAACVLIVVGIALGGGLFSRKPQAPVIPSDDGTVYGEIKLTVSKERKDKFTKELLLADRYVSDPSAKRFESLRFRFFDNEGDTYMIYREIGHVLKYENGSFIDTGIYPVAMQFFTSGSYKGYTYVGGEFHCYGGNEKGLFRVNLSNSVVEKVIDCDEEVVSVAVDGPQVYYSTQTGFRQDDARYSLKCADIEKKTITSIISDAEYPISDLQLVDGDLYFKSVGEGIRCITPDRTLKYYQTPCWPYYTVDNNTIYIDAPICIDDTNDKKPGISAYNMQGEWLGSVEMKTGREYDMITVYKGRVVFCDDEGIWLQDIISGEIEKIVDDPFKYRDSHYSRHIFHAVYDGKLFVSWRIKKDDVWYDMILVYDDGDIRETAFNFK